MLIAVFIMLYISILADFASVMQVVVELNANEMQCNAKNITKVCLY